MLIEGLIIAGGFVLALGAAYTVTLTGAFIYAIATGDARFLKQLLAEF